MLLCTTSENSKTRGKGPGALLASHKRGCRGGVLGPIFAAGFRSWRKAALEVANPVPGWSQTVPRGIARYDNYHYILSSSVFSRSNDLLSHLFLLLLLAAGQHSTRIALVYANVE